MLFIELPSINLTRDEIIVWKQVITILNEHGFTGIEMICYEHDLNNISRWLDTDQWKVFQKKCYPHIKLAGKVPPKVESQLEPIWVNL